MHNVVAVAFRLQKLPSEVAEMSTAELALCLAYMKRYPHG